MECVLEPLEYAPCHPTVLARLEFLGSIQSQISLTHKRLRMAVSCFKGMPLALPIPLFAEHVSVHSDLSCP
eukprot:608625-Hanusia_phi.AAC.3